MVEFSTKYEMLARAGITIVVTLAWCLAAYVAFAAPAESAETVTATVSIADLDLSVRPALPRCTSASSQRPARCAGRRPCARSMPCRSSSARGASASRRPLPVRFPGRTSRC